jgi:hypothetical protein
MAKFGNPAGTDRGMSLPFTAHESYPVAVLLFILPYVTVNTSPLTYVLVP